jgi:hypothetical protein
MSGCVEGGRLVFPEGNIEGFEVEARVLMSRFLNLNNTQIKIAIT